MSEDDALECGGATPLCPPRRDAAKESGDMSPHSKNWPHAPAHRLNERGAYMVTAGTYGKIPYLNTPARLDLGLDMLFRFAAEFCWKLQAWAIMSNHYHFVALSSDDPGNLSRFLGKYHMNLAKALNAEDGAPGRKVWHQFWDSRITFEKSYLARLNYVHNNPVRHGVVPVAERYRWCSAAWFARTAPAPFVKTVESFKTDRLKVPDDF